MRHIDTFYRVRDTVQPDHEEDAPFEVSVANHGNHLPRGLREMGCSAKLALHR